MCSLCLNCRCRSHHLPSFLWLLLAWHCETFARSSPPPPPCVACLGSASFRTDSAACSMVLFCPNCFCSLLPRCLRSSLTFYVLSFFVAVLSCLFIFLAACMSASKHAPPTLLPHTSLTMLLLPLVVTSCFFSENGHILLTQTVRVVCVPSSTRPRTVASCNRDVNQRRFFYQTWFISKHTDTHTYTNTWTRT